MATIKPVVEKQPLLDLLAQRFGRPVDSLQPLEGGLIAQTFAFSVAGRAYIIRINSDLMHANYEKEALISKTFCTRLVPIPQVIYVGRLHELHYCITRRALGQRLDRLSPEDTQRALPCVIKTLNAIHATDVSQQHGYGLFDGRGVGFFSSWPANLSCIREEGRPDGFVGKWHHLFQTSFLEPNVFDRVYATMESLLPFCPNERYLVHGEYGFGNLLVQDGQVTAVFDWIDAKYGDFLYDVAWLHFWDNARGYRELFRANYSERGVEVPNFDKRLLCYQCYIALNSMRFFSQSDNVEAYNLTRELILRLIAT